MMVKKVKTTVREPDTQAEYDFRGGVRGKYAARYAEGTNVVLLDPDVAELFPDSRTVNDALRALVAIASRRRRSTPSLRNELRGSTIAASCVPRPSAGRISARSK
jgi:hypothetical protein